MFLLIVSERFVLSLIVCEIPFFFCVFRGSLVVVIILHEQSPCAVLRRSLETSRCLKRAFEAVERLEVEEEFAVSAKKDVSTHIE